MKKILCFIMITAMLVVAACAPQTKRSNTMVLCLPSTGVYAHSIVRAGVEAGAKDAGLTVITAGEVELSAAERIELYKSVVAENKAGGVIVWSGDDTYYQMMRDMAADGVKIAVPYFHHEKADTETFIGANVAGNHKERGYQAADTLVALLREKGITGGTIGIGAAGAGGTPNQAYSYMRDRLAEIAPEYTLADTVFLGLDLSAATMKATGIINSNPDLVALFADMTPVGGQAIVQAAENAGRDDLILITCDESKENLDLLEQGKLDALMVSDLYQEGYQCAQNLAKLMAGEEVEWYTEIEEKVLTRESDLTYYKELWSRIQ